jgi:hypothetical protein
MNNALDEISRILEEHGVEVLRPDAMGQMGLKNQAAWTGFKGYSARD